MAFGRLGRAKWSSAAQRSAAQRWSQVRACHSCKAMHAEARRAGHARKQRQLQQPLARQRRSPCAVPKPVRSTTARQPPSGVRILADLSPTACSSLVPPNRTCILSRLMDSLRGCGARGQRASRTGARRCCRPGAWGLPPCLPTEPARQPTHTRILATHPPSSTWAPSPVRPPRGPSRTRTLPPPSSGSQPPTRAATQASQPTHPPTNQPPTWAWAPAPVRPPRRPSLGAHPPTARLAPLSDSRPPGRGLQLRGVHLIARGLPHRVLPLRRGLACARRRHGKGRCRAGLGAVGQDT